MTFKKFKRQFEAMIPKPNERITRAWMNFAEECATGHEWPFSDFADQLFRAYTFIRHNFEPEIVQELYRTREDCKALLPSELFWGAMFIQAGGTRQQAGEQAALGAFEIGMYLPDLFASGYQSRLALFALQTGMQESFYLTELNREPELLAEAVRQGASDLHISYQEALGRLKRDFTFLPRQRWGKGEWLIDAAFYKVTDLIAELARCNFLNGAAVSALVNFNGDSGVFEVQTNKRWLRAAREQRAVEESIIRSTQINGG